MIQQFYLESKKNKQSENRIAYIDGEFMVAFPTDKPKEKFKHVCGEDPNFFNCLTLEEICEKGNLSKRKITRFKKTQWESVTLVRESILEFCIRRFCEEEDEPIKVFSWHKTRGEAIKERERLFKSLPKEKLNGNYRYYVSSPLDFEDGEINGCTTSGNTERYCLRIVKDGREDGKPGDYARSAGESLLEAGLCFIYNDIINILSSIRGKSRPFAGPYYEIYDLLEDKVVITEDNIISFFDVSIVRVHNHDIKELQEKISSYDDNDICVCDDRVFVYYIQEYYKKLENANTYMGYRWDAAPIKKLKQLIINEDMQKLYKVWEKKYTYGNILDVAVLRYRPDLCRTINTCLLKKPFKAMF